jgi:hypothetical protein
MVAGQHKLSRRAVLAGACAGVALPLPLHAGEDLGKAWRKAFARLTSAQAEIDALAHSPDEDAYDRAVDRQNAARGRVLRAPAPDLAAVGVKIALIAAEQAWELSFGEAAFAVLAEDVRRLGG